MSGCSHCMGTGYRLVPNKFGDISMSNDMCHYCGGRGKIKQDEPSDIDIMNDLQRQNNQLKSENDKLRAENERLREGLQKIYNLVNDSNTEYAVQLVITMQDEAQQALKEVTK